MAERRRDGRNGEECERGVADLWVQVPAGDLIPLSGLGPGAARELGSLLTHALTTRALASEESDAGAAHLRRDFAAEVRRVVGRHERAGRPPEVRTAWDRLGRFLYTALVGTRPAPDHIVADAFLEELEWRFGSRYAAVQEIGRRLERAEGNCVTESSLSKLARGQGGVKLGRLSEVACLLELEFTVSGSRRRPRLCALPEEASQAKPSRRPAVVPAASPAAAVAEWWVARSSSDDPAPEIDVSETSWENEPFVVLTTSSTGPVERLVPVTPWSGRLDGLLEFLTGIATDLGSYVTPEGPSTADPPTVVDFQPREVLAQPSSVIPAGVAIVVSAFDLGCPLVAGANAVGWIEPGSETPPAPRRVPDDALRDRIKRLRTAAFDDTWAETSKVLLLAAHASTAAFLDRRGRLPSPVPREVAWHGPEAILLMDHLAAAADRRGTAKAPAPTSTPPLEAAIEAANRSAFTGRSR